MTKTEEIAVKLTEMGFTFSAEFVPYSHSRNADKWQSINWDITLKRGRRSLRTPCAQGIAHLPFSLAEYPPDYSRMSRTERIENAIENGTWRPVNGNLWGSVRSLPLPSITDILYCIVMDYDVLEYGTFEEWAESFGYDTDSRRAHKDYKACLKQSLKFKAMAGDIIDNLREIFQDY